jgi:hypothetical protein
LNYEKETGKEGTKKKEFNVQTFSHVSEIIAFEVD